MKKRQVVIYIVVMLVLLCTSVYATIGGDINVSTSAGETLKAGDEFTLTLSLKDIEATDGVKAVEGYIDIDENVLEPITVNSIETKDGKVEIDSDNILSVTEEVSTGTTEGTVGNESGIIFNNKPVSGKGDYRIVINFAKAIDSDVDLLKITFKVKADVKDGTYKDAVSYKIFRLFSKTEKLVIEDKALSLVVKAPVPENNTDNDTNNTANNVANNNVTNNTNNNITNNNVTNNIANNNVKNNAVNNANNNTNKPVAGTTNNSVDNTVASSNLPNTGYRLILIPVVAVAIIGLVFYKKYKKYNNI